MPTNDSSDYQYISRRRWLEAMGVTGAVTLAGCAGDEEPVDHEADPDPDDDDDGAADDTGTGDDDDGDEEAQRLNYMRGGDHFPDIQWNPQADQYNSTIANVVNTPTYIVREADNVLSEWGVSNWEYDPDSRAMELEMRDDLLFWNGDQYTAHDLYAYQELVRQMNPDGSVYEEITVLDDTTIEFVTKESINPQIAYRSRAPIELHLGGEEVWNQWVEQYEDAPDEDARDDITAELIEWRIETDELMENGWGNGTFQIDDVTDEYMDLVAFEDHPLWGAAEELWGTDPNIDEIRIWYADETGRREQFIVNERVDVAGHGHSWSAFEDVLPDYWEEIVYFPRPNFRKMNINWRNREYLQDVNFRRAMAAAMDFENHAINVEEFPVEMHSGMGRGYNESYWGNPVPDQLIDYDVNRNEELAEEYLERAGITREDGTMWDEDGEQLEDMRFIVGGGPWGDVAQSAAQQLQQFGFPVDVRAVGRSAKLDIINNEMTDWDLTTETHFVMITNHPTEYFRPDSFWGWRIGPSGFGPEPEWGDLVNQWLEDGETHSPWNGKPMVFEVPEEVGQQDLSGSTREVNLVEMYNEGISPISEERDQEIVQTLSWAWNFLLPDIDLTATLSNEFGNTQKIEFGPEEDLVSYHTLFRPTQGAMRLRE